MNNYLWTFFLNIILVLIIPLIFVAPIANHSFMLVFWVLGYSIFELVADLKRMELNAVDLKFGIIAYFITAIWNYFLFITVSFSIATNATPSIIFIYAICLLAIFSGAELLVDKRIKKIYEII